MKKGKIRVALIAPPFGEIGGPEVVVKNLAEALSKKSIIDLTLFSPADWNIQGIKRINTLKKSLWNMKDFQKQTSRERRNLIVYSQLKVILFEKNFDIIHSNSQAYAYLIAKLTRKPVVLSLHNRINKREFKQIKTAGIHTISLSTSQRGLLETTATIWNGVPVEKIKYSTKNKKNSYLIAIGRIAEQKGIDTAIKIAIKAKKKLLIFGRVGISETRKKYFNQKIKPYLNKTNIVFKKEVPHKEIYKYLRNAEALLFPIVRPEVCPMAVIEALACGTPIIGTKINPLPELLSNKKVAFLSDDLNKLVKAVKNIHQFNRSECRKYAEKNFNSSIMAKKYVTIYKKILQK